MLRRGLPWLTVSLLPPLAVVAATTEPTSQPARPEVARAQAEYDDAVQAAREAFRGTDAYRAAEEKVRQAESSLDSARAADDASPEAITAAAGDSLDSRAMLQRMETRAIQADPKVAAALAKLQAARRPAGATTQPASIPSDQPGDSRAN